jgi:hypothetical protein
MNPALARLLTRLYPRPWRERYGAEFEAFLQTGPGGSAHGSTSSARPYANASSQPREAT